MTSINVFNALGGLGLFLFSLRFLTQALNRSIAQRLKGVMEMAFATPLRAIFSGLLATALVQASSITIIALMGLVASSIITVEQGYYAMLGAVVGTTLKAWLFADVEHCGGLIIGITSISLIFVRRKFFRESLEVILAIGFTFFGLEMLAAGLSPLAKEPGFVQWMTQFNGKTLGAQFMGALVGCGLTMAIQSSTTVVFLTIDLAHQGLIGFPGGASLILGANVGTTITPLLAALEVDATPRRIAVGHVLIKILGVIITLFFFPYFLWVVDMLMNAAGIHAIEPRLAGVHTLFAVCEAVTFGMLGGIMLKWLTRLVPETVVHSTTALPAVVRRLLSRSPQRALQEADRQVVVLDRQTKALIDSCFQLVMEGARFQGKRTEDARFRRDFEALREAVNDLLLRLGRQRLTVAQREKMHRTLRVLGRFQDVQSQGLSLLNKLNIGVGERGYAFPSSMSELLSGYQSAFNALWLHVHFRHAVDFANVDALRQSSDLLESYVLDHVLEDSNLPPEQCSWTYETITRMRVLGETLVSLAQVVSEEEGEERGA